MRFALRGTAVILAVTAGLTGCNNSTPDTGADAAPVDSNTTPAVYRGRLDCRVFSDGVIDYAPGAQGWETPEQAVSSHLKQSETLAMGRVTDHSAKVFALDLHGRPTAIFILGWYGEGWLVNITTRCSK